MMLHAAIRAYVQSQKKKQKFSFRSYLFDLVMLLSESITGNALTTVFVCVSQAPSNTSITANALDFGKVFSKLTVHKRQVTPIQYEKKEQNAREKLKMAQTALANVSSPIYRAM